MSQSEDEIISIAKLLCRQIERVLLYENNKLNLAAFYARRSDRPYQRLLRIS
jgi:hypothetical protein